VMWAEVNRLERVGIEAFGATSQFMMGDWVVVASDGPARRANAIHPIGDPGRSVGDALAAASQSLEPHGRSVICKLAAPPGYPQA